MTDSPRRLYDTAAVCNLTGFFGFSAELGAKWLALLHELVPSTATIGFLENPREIYRQVGL